MLFVFTYFLREPFDLTAAIFAVIRGHILDLDLCTIETPSQKIYSFLSLAWGIISDVDIESEKYRYLGNARFTLGAVIRILGLRTYRGRLSYLPHDDDDDDDDSDDSHQNTSNIDVPKQQQTQNEDESRFFSFPNSPDGFNYNENRSQVNEKLQSIAGLDNAGYVKSPFTSVDGISHQLNESPQTKYLPPLQSQLPSNWKTVEGVFILGCAVLLSHLGPDLFVSPSAKFGDGLLHIAYLKSGVSKLRLLSLFNEMETGGHLDSTECVYLKARAYRLEPDLSQPGTIAIDGERIPYSVVQGEIHKGLGRVMCSRPY